MVETMIKVCIERGRGKKKDVTAKRTTYETDQL